MSRIGNKPVSVPAGVTIAVEGNLLKVKGPKGELSQEVPAGISINVAEGSATVSRANEARQTRAYHGLVRSLLSNMVTGVSQGYEKKLELVGTGYRAALQGNKLVLSVGFSHPVEIEQVEGVQFAVEGNNKISIKGISKYLVGQVAANIRKVRKPEPYKGKGIRYEGEVVRRKAGKTAGKTA